MSRPRARACGVSRPSRTAAGKITFSSAVKSAGGRFRRHRIDPGKPADRFPLCWRAVAGGAQQACEEPVGGGSFEPLLTVDAGVANGRYREEQFEKRLAEMPKNTSITQAARVLRTAKRVLVIGCSGGGKSRLSLKISERFDLEYLSYDRDVRWLAAWLAGSRARGATSDCR